MIEDLVYDVGMGDGADTAYYLAKGRRVVAIDANPLAVERRRKSSPMRSERGASRS
jgi:phosphopantothenate synthetase